MNVLKLSASFFLLYLSSGSAFSQPQTEDVSKQSSRVENTQYNYSKFSDADLRERFSITQDEAKRYDKIMSGMARFWYPNINPLEVLLIYARTDAERMDLAKRVAQIEDARNEREFAAQRAHHRAVELLFPNKPMIRTNPMSILSGASKAPRGLTSSDDYSGILSVIVGGFERDAVVDELLAEQMRSPRFTQFNVYFGPGMDNEDSITKWARERSITPAIMKSKSITFNFVVRSNPINTFYNNSPENRGAYMISNGRFVRLTK